MPIQAANPFGAYIQGRAARQDEEYADTRNALAQQDIETSKLRNKLAQDQYSQAQIQQALQQTAATAARLAQSPNVRAELQQYPEFAQGLAKQHPEIAQMQDDELRQYLGFVAGQAQSKLGIGPSAPVGPMSAQGKIGADVRGGYLTQAQADAALNPGMTPYQKERLDIERQKLNQPKPIVQFVALTPEEIQKAGLPAGTSAQRDTQTGKIDILSKRDNTGVLSQKDATTAKNKLTTIRVARKQLEDIKTAFSAIQNTMSAGPFGQGRIPTEAGRKFDSAVGRMRSTLTALTRVPGVGAMSDYETKLDQQKFPERNNYESVTADQIQGVDDLITILERGYGDLISGGASQSEQEIQQQSPQGEVRVSTPQEALALPPGTVFITPDGRRKVR